MTSYASPLDSSERVLADGRVVTPGIIVELTKEDEKDEHNKRLIDEGQLVKVVAIKEQKGA